MSACACVQFDQGLSCPQTKSLDTTKCMNGQHRLRWYFGYAQDGQTKFAHLAHVWRHFLFDAAHMRLHINCYLEYRNISFLTLVLLNQDMSCLCKQCRSRSVCFSYTLPLTMWTYINNQDQVIWLAKNEIGAWHLNLFSMTTWKKLEGHIAYGLFVCSSIHHT